MSHLQSNLHRRVRNQVQRGAFKELLLNGMIQLWSFPDHARDVDLIRFSFAGYRTEPAECCVRTVMDAMDSIVLSSFDACCTIQFLCHTLSPPHFPLQLPAYEPSSWLDQGCNDCIYRWKWMRHGHCPILTMNVNWASTIFGLVYWIIKASRKCMSSYLYYSPR